MGLSIPLVFAFFCYAWFARLFLAAGRIHSILPLSSLQKSLFAPASILVPGGLTTALFVLPCWWFEGLAYVREVFPNIFIALGAIGLVASLPLLAENPRKQSFSFQLVFMPFFILIIAYGWGDRVLYPADLRLKTLNAVILLSFGFLAAYLRFAHFRTLALSQTGRRGNE